MPKISEDDYRSCVLDIKLESLGYPVKDIKFVRRGASNRFKVYGGDYQPDYIFYFENRPILDVEAKPSESQFDNVYDQATFYARNFRIKDQPFTIPYIICASGDKIKMYKAVASKTGLGVEFEELKEILSWTALLDKIKQALKPATIEIASETTLGIEKFRDIFEEIYKTLSESGRPKFNNDDEIVMTMNEIIRATLNLQDKIKIYERYSLSKKVINRIEEILGWYDLNKIEGNNLAYAYRDFITRAFTGTVAWWMREKDKEIGRYLTPAGIIDFMVKVSEPQSIDKIIDFACGSGGFIGGVLGYLKGKIQPQKFLESNIFTCDVDEFSVSTAKTFLELLLPGKQENLNIFHHNGLWSEKVHSWEKNDLSDMIKSEFFDLVISNPPAGADYNLGHESHLSKVLPLIDLNKKCQNAPLFIQRAIQLAKNDGKICFIVPDGILANTQLKYIRDYISQTCQVEMVVSLPRIFPNVTSKMSIIYMKKCKEPNPKEPIFSAIVSQTEESNLEVELESIYKRWAVRSKK